MLVQEKKTRKKARLNCGAPNIDTRSGCSFRCQNEVPSRIIFCDFFSSRYATWKVRISTFWISIFEKKGISKKSNMREQVQQKKPSKSKKQLNFKYLCLLMTFILSTWLGYACIKLEQLIWIGYQCYFDCLIHFSEIKFLCSRCREIEIMQ